MKQQKMLNTNKGITLIALIITIIVMLILVAVTISMAVNGGLFEYAGKATADTNNVIGEEQQLASGKITIDNKVYNSIDEYLSKGNKEKVHNWSKTGDSVTCSHCNASYVIGEYIPYHATGTTKINSSKLGTEINGEEELTVRNYIIPWVVLGIADKDNDGKNETLLITTETSVGIKGQITKIPLCGATGYNNAVTYYDAENNVVEGELDRICRELYSNSEYGQARSITVDDINNIIGYEPKYSMYMINTESNGEQMVGLKGFDTKVKELPENIWQAIQKTGTYTPDGTDLGEFKINGYLYQIKEENGKIYIGEFTETGPSIRELEISETVNNLLFKERYWIASRGISVGFDEINNVGIVTFGIGKALEGLIDLGVFDYNYISEEEANIYIDEYIRPVVELRDKLPEPPEEITFIINAGSLEEEYTVKYGTTWAEWVESFGYQHNYALSSDGKVVWSVHPADPEIVFGYVKTQGDADITVIKPKEYVYISFPQ